MAARPLKRSMLFACAASMALANAALAASPPSRTYEFDIRRVPLSQALKVFSRAAKQPIIYSEHVVRGKIAPPVRGKLTIDQALSQLLQGTNLVTVRTRAGTVMIRPDVQSEVKQPRLIQMAARAPSAPMRRLDDAADPEEPRTEIEDIVVTARKREESLQDVPVAVTAISADTLQANLASDLTKMGELAPQVSIGQGGSGTGGVITIRGISSSPSDSAVDQSVALEFDNVPISRASIISSALFDIGQVQVLQGPQALFFGKNSPAGVISISSADPTSDLEGYLRAGYEFKADERYVEGALSGPLTETLRGRIAFRARKMEGWIRNVAVPRPDRRNPAVTVPGANWGKRAPASEDHAGRLTLAWQPSADFDAKLKVLVNSQEQNHGNANTEPFCIAPTVTPVWAGNIPMDTGDCKKNMVKSHTGIAPVYAVNFPNGNDGVPYFRSKYVFGSLTLNKRFDDLLLTYTAGYYRQKANFLLVAGDNPFGEIWSTIGERYRLITQELRAETDIDGPINLMAGLYFEDVSRPHIHAVEQNHVFDPDTQSYATAVKRTRNSSSAFSAFAQVRWNIVPELELAAGARYSKDKKSLDAVHTQLGPAATTFYPEGQHLISRYRDENVSPEVTLTWHPQPRHTLYAAFKTGYKAGGLSNPAILPRTATPDTIRFKSEEVEGFEAGYKATVLDNRLRFDVVGYRYTYKDLQVVAFDVNTISFNLRNAASARIYGVQTSADWLVTDGLTLSGNIGYNSAKYLNFPNSQCYSGQTAALGCVGGQQDLSGTRLARAPKLTFSLGADYETAISSGWKAAASVRGTRTSSYNASSDRAPGGFQEAYWLLNASLRFGPEDEAYELALLGRNLTNSYYMLQTTGWTGTGNPNQYLGTFNRPREIVVQATARF